MVYDRGVLKASLAAAVGDDPVLVAELRAAFVEGARRHLDALLAAPCSGDWRAAAWRLQSLAASFGASELMAMAERIASGQTRDLVLIRRLATGFTAV